jgi:hypothetical protein
MIRAALILAILATPALAKYGEGLRSIGLIAGDGGALSTAMEIHVNEETGTWTILQMRPDGMACLVAYGEYWSAVAPKKGDPA